MAKEIVTWCSIHLNEHEERVPGAEEEITINGKTRLIDLCPPCRDQHLATLEKILEDHGETPKRKYVKKSTTSPAAAVAAASTGSGASPKYKPNEDGKYECPEPFCGRIFDKAQGLGRHMTAHQKSA